MRSKLLLVGRLVTRDIRRRPAQAALLLLAIAAASATLTMSLVVHGVTSNPYAQTSAATRGPDIIAQLGGGPTFNNGSGTHSGTPPGGPASALTSGPHGPGPAATSKQVAAQASALIHARGVTAHSGPFLVAGALLRVRNLAVGVQLQGRGQAPAAVDQPKLTAGSWVRPGGVVLERSFASALGVGVGDRITLNGKPYTVAGTAVTAASTPYPNLCFTGGCQGALPPYNGIIEGHGNGLGWVTQPDARVLAAADGAPPSYVLNLKLADPASANAFATAYDHAHQGIGSASLMSWQTVAAGDALLVIDEQQVLSVGAWLLGLLAVASVAVLVGGRMAQRTRQVGLLKAVGATPALVSAVLLAENLALAVAAAAAGLVAGTLAAPLITSPGAGLIGTAGGPSLTLPVAAEVAGLALAVALVATLVPAIRAARTSTIGALADAARSPHRGTGLIRISARLPVPLLLGLRLVARRPRRAVLGAASVAVTVMGIVAVLAFHYMGDQQRFGNAAGLGDPVISRDEQMLLVITIALVALAALNAIFTAWATVLDARHATALTRALGASPRQVSAGLAAAQVVPALPGVIIGIPLGIGLFLAANGDPMASAPPAGWIAVAALGTLVVVAGLTTIPARLGVRKSPSEALGQEA
jgi:ABC-type antimicrobial peptide transport system permease subunit